MYHHKTKRFGFALAKKSTLLQLPQLVYLHPILHRSRCAVCCSCLELTRFLPALCERIHFRNSAVASQTGTLWFHLIGCIQITDASLAPKDCLDR